MPTWYQNAINQRHAREETHITQSNPCRIRVGICIMDISVKTSISPSFKGGNSKFLSDTAISSVWFFECYTSARQVRNTAKEMRTRILRWPICIVIAHSINNN